MGLIGLALSALTNIIDFLLLICIYDVLTHLVFPPLFLLLFSLSWCSTLYYSLKLEQALSSKQRLSKEELKLLQKKFTTLQKFQQNKFFKEGIDILFIFVRTNNSELLSKFIAAELTNLKRHHFFLNFIKETLEVFYNKNFSNCKGIKIQVKGRFNGAPRAKRRLINIGKKIPTLTINSKLNYAEKTSFTPNGTFGVKIWVNKKTN